MVGNAPPRLDELRASVRSMEVIRWYVDNKDAVRELEDTIRRQEESAERAGVGKDLNVARETAKRLVADAEARAQAIISEADKIKAQADEIIAGARKERAKADDGLSSLVTANEAHRKAVEEQKVDLFKRAKVLDDRERALVVRENQAKMHEDRVRARESRLEAALRGP